MPFNHVLYRLDSFHKVFGRHLLGLLSRLDFVSKAFTIMVHGDVQSHFLSFLEFIPPSRLSDKVFVRLRYPDSITST